MATRTRAQLVARAAQRIGVLAAGQTLSAEDSDLIDDQLEPLLEDLAERGVLTIVDPATIENRYFHPLADILGYFVAPDFGVSLDELRALGVDGTAEGAAERRLRKVQATVALDAPVRADYF